MKRKHDYEQILADQIKGAGYRFIREHRFDPKRLWRVDFFLPDFSLVVEVEGVKYRGQSRHQTAQGFEADCEKYNALVTKMRYYLLRFTPKMVLGNATRGKARHPIPPAIETIKDFCERLDK